MKKSMFIIVFFIIIMTAVFGDEKKDIGIYAAFSEEQLRTEEKNLSSQPESYERNYKMGLIFYFLASNGKEQAATSIGYLEKALKTKDNDFIRAYLGSAWTIAGDQAPNVMDKIKFVNTGTGMLDGSYKKLENEYSFLVMYVQNNLSLPDIIFHRYKNANIGIIKLEGNFETLDNEKKAEVLFFKASYLQKTGKQKESITLFEKITLDYKNSKYAALSKKMIEKYGE